MTHVLVQHACGKPDLLDCARKRHAEYASDRSAAYITGSASAVSRLMDPRWNRPRAIQAALDVLPDGEIVVWLDPEALIVTAESIFDVLPAAGQLACPRVGRWLHPGALWIRASADTIS